MSPGGDLDGRARVEPNFGEPPIRQIRTINFRNMKKVRELGRGGMGQINLYELHNMPKLPKHVAMKSLFEGSIPERNFEKQLRTEMTILTQLKHDNIVETFGVVDTGREFGLVMQYVRFGSYKKFFSRLLQRIKYTQDFEQRLVPLKIRILDEVTDAMKYLHGYQPEAVLHLDLKSENVLLDNELHAKICDFGLSRMKTLTSLRSSLTVQGAPGGRPSGTPAHIAPERLRDAREKPSRKTDVYSFGILEWEILTHEDPYGDIAGLDFYTVLKNQIVDDNLRPREKALPAIYGEKLPELVDMMKRCWSRNPLDRPTFEKLNEELKSIESRIPDFRKQAKTSAQIVLNEWNLNYCSRPTGVSTSATEPRNPHIGIVRARSLNCDFPSREVSSMPTRIQDKARYQTTLQSDFDHTEETMPLIVKGVSPEKIFCSTRMVLPIVSFLFCVMVSGGIVFGFLTSQHGIPSGCQSLHPPSHGEMNCTSDETEISQTCTFTCNTGYLPKGPENVACIGGKWNGKEPICSPCCSALEPVQFADVTCTDSRFENSTCNFTCVENREIQGFKSLICETNRKWSHPEPICICPKCLIGDKCQYSIDWNAVAKTLGQMQAGAVITVHYGEEVFACKVDVHSVIPFTWSGECTDIKTQTVQKCSKYQSPAGAAKHAAAELIRTLVRQKKYPEPCDPGDMETGC